MHSPLHLSMPCEMWLNKYGFNSQINWKRMELWNGVINYSLCEAPLAVNGTWMLVNCIGEDSTGGFFCVFVYAGNYYWVTPGDHNGRTYLQIMHQGVIDRRFNWIILLVTRTIQAHMCASTHKIYYHSSTMLARCWTINIVNIIISICWQLCLIYYFIETLLLGDKR